MGPQAAQPFTMTHEHADQRRCRWPALALTWSLAASLTLGLACAPAAAQFGGGGGPGRGGAGPGGGPDGGGDKSQRAEGFSTPAAKLNQLADRLLSLRLQLQLDTAQNAAWDTFQRQLLNWARDQQRGRYASADQPALSALNRRLTDARQREALLSAVVSSASTLEQRLSPSQRHTWDQQLAPLLPE